MTKKNYLLLGMAALAYTNSYANDITKVDSTLLLKEIVISTTRIPEIKSNAATTVTIIDQKQIAQMSKAETDISHLLGLLTPGMALASNTTSSRTQSLRGRSALVLIDGIPQSTPLRSTDRDIRSLDVSAIDHIEIIKGATSLYGNGAIGGVINIITKKNTTKKTFAGQSSLSGSTYNFYHGSDGMGYRFNQQFYGSINKLSYLVSGTLSKTGSSIDGDGEYISPRYGLGDTYTSNALVKLGYAFSPKNSIEFMYNFYRSLQHTSLIQQKGEYLKTPAIGIFGDKDPQASDEGTRYNHNAYLKFTSRKLFANTDFEASLYGTSLYTIFDFRKHNPKKPRWEETSGQATIKDQKFGFRSQFNTLLTFSDNSFTRLVYGFDYLLDKTSQPLVDGRYWVPNLTSNNEAIFLQTKTTLSKDLNIKVGARYDIIDVNVPNYDILRTKKSAPEVHVKGGNLKYNNLSFNAGISYNKYRAFQPFIAYSQGFSIFDLGRTLRAAKEDVLSKILTEPVKTDNYEIGAYSDINRWLQLNGAFFYTYSKLGSDLKINKAGFWEVNRTPQKVYGIELNADAQLLNNLKAGANFTWFEGKIKDTYGQWSRYMSNISIPAAKFAMYIDYSPVKNAYLQLHYIHSGNRDRFKPINDGKYNEGEGKISSFNLLNFTAGYKLNSWDINLGISNLLNNTYYTTTSMLMARDAEYAHADGRKISLTVTFKY